jgi:hypothetical protein
MVTTMALAVLAACATSGDPSGASTPSGTDAAVSLPPSSNPNPVPADDGGEDAANIDPDAGPSFTYGEWTGWSVCSETCADAGPGVKTRTRECKRRDGIVVGCALCGDACTETMPCTGSPTGCCGPRTTCCPVSPSNFVGGDIAGCTAGLAARADECTSKGCLWTGATACTIGGSPSSATLPGGRGTCQ